MSRKIYNDDEQIIGEYDVDELIAYCIAFGAAGFLAINLIILFAGALP